MQLLFFIFYSEKNKLFLIILHESKSDRNNSTRVNYLNMFRVANSKHA